MSVHGVYARPPAPAPALARNAKGGPHRAPRPSAPGGSRNFPLSRAGRLRSRQDGARPGLREAPSVGATQQAKRDQGDPRLDSSNASSSSPDRRSKTQSAASEPPPGANPPASRSESGGLPGVASFADRHSRAICRP